MVDGRPSVVKGEKFVDLKRQGDPVELARRYQDQGADELIFLDITASHEQKDRGGCGCRWQMQSISPLL